MALALVVGFGGGFGAAKLLLSDSSEAPAQQVTPAPSAPAPAAGQPPPIVQIATEGRPFLGPEDAKVTVVEFTDYQCPFCKRHFDQTTPLLLQEYEGRIKLVVMNFPLNNIHPFAQKAAEAAECANDQGEFWEYHDLLFENQNALDVASLKRHAGNLLLDQAAFDDCLDSGAKSQQVQQDLQAGQRAGVTGTPSFFINGHNLRGALPFASFKSLIDAALDG